jgi:chromosome segregation ATPase
MIKRIILGAGASLLVGVLFFGRDLVSYVQTSAGYVKDSVTNSVPVQFQIDRARTMIKDLVKEIRENMHVIAKEEAEVARLEQKITDAQTGLNKDKEELLRLKTDLNTGKGPFRYAGRNYSADEVKTDLANRFQRYKTNEATLTSLQQIHKARQKSLDAARQKLEGMLASRRQLGVEVENLEARLQMVAAAQTTSNYNFDDSQLGRVKELVSDLKTRVDVAERMVSAEGSFHDEIPLDQPSADNIMEQVSQYFTPRPDQAKVQPKAEDLAKH